MLGAGGQLSLPPRVMADPSAAGTEPTSINSEWMSFNTCFYLGPRPRTAGDSDLSL